MTLDQIFSFAIKKNASDVHIIVGLAPILRINGSLKELKEADKMSFSEMREIVFRILTEQQKERLERERELDFSYQIKDSSRLRVNCFFEKGNLGLVARIIPAEIPSMDSLDMPKIIFDLTREPQGLI